MEIKLVSQHNLYSKKLIAEFYIGGRIEGEIDFFLNGSLRWGIKLFVLGHGIGEHIDRFGRTGKYSKLGVKDYAVLDFRFSQDGEPTHVQYHDKRVTVFFKEGDFSRCKCIFGLEQNAVLLHMKH
jgi:hypothetical protein